MDGLTGEEEQKIIHEIDHAEEIEKQLNDLFDVVSKRIRLSISAGKLTSDSFQVILLKIVETVQEFSDKLPTHISGVEKRNIATSLTERIIDNLHEHGQIDDDIYGWLKLSLTFLAPVLFNGIKAIYHQIHDVAEDISDNGCHGCFRRNFRNKK